jgi:hypothetical protein
MLCCLGEYQRCIRSSAHVQFGICASEELRLDYRKTFRISTPTKVTIDGSGIDRDIVEVHVRPEAQTLTVRVAGKGARPNWKKSGIFGRGPIGNAKVKGLSIR